MRCIKRCLHEYLETYLIESQGIIMPIEMVTSASIQYTFDQALFLHDIGFTSVVTHGVSPTREWEHVIRDVKKAGLKFIPRFPDWHGLHLCQEPFLFRASDGKTNATFPGENSRVCGASYWHPEANERAIQSLQPLVDMGIDGVLVSPLVSDRWYSTDFYPFGCYEQRYTKSYWSFDDYARASWKEVSDQPMPEMAYPGPEGSPPPGYLLDFYRWYQNGVFSRLYTIADAVLEAGLKHVWTWWIPLDFWDEENMADGTASSSSGVHAWRNYVMERADSCFTVQACIFGLWSRWRGPGLDTMKHCNQDLGWTSIPGAEAWAPHAFANVAWHAQLAKQHGYSGLFCSDVNFLIPEFAVEARDTMAKAVGEFAS
jgi:hypothetical protein